MRRNAISLFAGFCLSVSLAAGASMTGWISDEACGAGNASAKAEARECAKACIKGGHAAVFVNDADGKVYKLADAAKAKDHLDHKVKVSGDVKGNILTVADIKKAD